MQISGGNDHLKEWIKKREREWDWMNWKYFHLLWLYFKRWKNFWKKLSIRILCHRKWFHEHIYTFRKVIPLSSEHTHTQCVTHTYPHFWGQFQTLKFKVNRSNFIFIQELIKLRSKRERNFFEPILAHHPSWNCYYISAAKENFSIFSKAVLDYIEWIKFFENARMREVTFSTKGFNKQPRFMDEKSHFKFIELWNGRKVTKYNHDIDMNIVVLKIQTNSSTEPFSTTWRHRMLFQRNKLKTFSSSSINTCYVRVRK